MIESLNTYTGQCMPGKVRRPVGVGASNNTEFLLYFLINVMPVNSGLSPSSMNSGTKTQAVVSAEAARLHRK